MKVNDHPNDPRYTSGKNVSYWTDSVRNTAANPLQENLKTDVVIIGGGLAGLSVAYCLQESGKNIVLVEDGAIGSGETGRTTAHLVTALDDRYYTFEETFGEEKMKLVAESHQLAIDFVEEVVRKEKIDCGFERVDGYLFLHPTDKKESLNKELEAARKAGVEIETTTKVPGLMGHEKGLVFKNQAQFHPLRYLKGLVKAIEKRGGKIYTNTHAEEIDHEGIKTSDGFTVKAKHIVVATNSPVNNHFTMFEKQYPYRTYVIGALIKRGVLPNALWWDTGDFEVNSSVPPYHYVRVCSYDDEHDLLISGGEDHPTGDTTKTEVAEQDRYKLVEDWTLKHFPVQKFLYRWSGQVLEPMDGVAFIGRNPYDKDNVYIVTGDSGNGMTHCSFAGLLISDLINGKENKWEELYSPSRFTISESGPMFSQMAKETMNYLKQWANFNDTDELDLVKNGEGKIVNMLEEQFGVYRDEKGKLFIVSAQCTHIKCGLVWNADELSWDCPCHGSRFTYEGKVVQGPANYDLPTFHYDAKKENLEKE